MVNIRASHNCQPKVPIALLRVGLLVLTALALTQCASGPRPKLHADVVVSVKDQKLAIYNNSGGVGRKYPVSTSKFGESDKPGTYDTPLGMHEIVAKIGHGAPAGAVLKFRQWTGEVIKPDSPGRDPIVSRIMWLRGLESTNKNAYARCIYIHGTAEERNIGKPVSYGCIRMKSRDVMELFDRLPIGSRVLVTEGALPTKVPVVPGSAPGQPEPGSQPPIFLDAEQHASHPPLVAQNTTPAQRRPEPTPAASPKPVTATQSRKKEKESPQPTAAAQVPPSPSGSSIIYTAPTPTTPGVALKTRRSAGQATQN